jgi:DNA-binding CsgD family transcriptional regulator
MLERSQSEAVKFLQKASDYDNAAALEAHFLRVLAAFGFDRYDCIKLEAGAEGNDVTHIAGSGMGDWDQHWNDARYIEVDPVSQLVLARTRPFSWTDARDWRNRTAGHAGSKESQLWGEARDNGMGDGLISYAYGPGGELLVVRMTTECTGVRPEDRPMLDAIAIVFSTVRLRLHERDADRPQGELTVREQQCLRWASQGLVDLEIAEQLKISSKTVAFHMENAKRKLGARNRLAAYRRALELGYMAT